MPSDDEKQKDNTVQQDDVTPKDIHKEQPDGEKTDEKSEQMTKPKFSILKWIGSIFSKIRSVVKEIIVPIHREGWAFIAISAAATVFLGAFSSFLLFVGTVITVWMIYFFRDPIRVVPTDPELFVSPCDGRVCLIEKVVPHPDMLLGDVPMQRLSIFMNVFDCHVNRLPIGGTIENIAYHKGAFLSAELDKASDENERNSLTVSFGKYRYGVVQIAGAVARRIFCDRKVGEELLTGERFGLIRFGSRVDIYLPDQATIMVGIGQRCTSGETIVAQMNFKGKAYKFRQN